MGPIGVATQVSISKAFTILDQGPAIGSWVALEEEGMGWVVQERLWAMVEAGVTQGAEGFIIWKGGV